MANLVIGILWFGSVFVFLSVAGLFALMVNTFICLAV
jgi:hypothetical protein